MNIYYQIPELKAVAVALGCFDGIHLGHRAVMERLHDPSFDDLDKAVFSFSDAPSFKKGAELIATFEDKCGILSEMGMQELILPSFDSVRDYSPESFFSEILVKRLDARLLVCGENYRFGRYASGDSELLQRLSAEQGIRCIVVPSVMYGGSMISSSRIRAALAAGDVESAAKMLGRQFSYCLEVVHGRKLGRELGTPTINQYFPDNFLIPAYGVYASVTGIDGKLYSSVTNIGVKPTVGSDRPLSETWVIGYSGDLYGRKIRVSLISHMRDECRFSSMEKLKEAIHSDSVNSVSLTRDYL